MRHVLALLILLVGTKPLIAEAQVTPSDMVGGVDSIRVQAAGSTSCRSWSKALYTVPTGMTLVLTDVSGTPPAAGSWSVLDNGALRMPGFATSNTGRPPSEHLSTGIVFQAGHVLTFLVSDCPPSTASDYYLRCFWSGYLVPVIVGAVPQAHDRQLRFSIAPNPSGQVVRLRFELAGPSEVSLIIFDAQGRQVKTLARGLAMAGSHTCAWDGRSDEGEIVAAGIYFARLESQQAKSVRRLVRVH